jgi:hypothetical protein
MGTVSSFSGKQDPKRDAESLLAEAERLLATGDVLAAMRFMKTDQFRALPREITGPGGPLHDRLLKLLSDIKASVERAR